MPSSTQTDSSFFYVLDERMRLLFADDDPILREFAKVHLATESATVLTAGDGEEAWAALRRDAFDLALVDLEMPKLDGFELVKRIRSTPRTAHLPVVVCTGREDIAAIDRAFECGATGFVTKPINWRLLSYQVRFVMRAHRTENSLEQARAGTESAQAGSMARAMMRESAELLAMAMRGDEAMRDAARRYAAVLGDLVSAETAVKSRQAA
ncbi:MAG: response regulator [Proteobacteria bacterium]|nr:response regulator [Pseudomonadota bacterium]